MKQIIYDLQDLSYLSWSKIRNSSGTAGSFLKSQEDTPEGRIYYKLSDYDPYQGIVGHESVNEIIADRLLTILGIPHLNYWLINADIIVEDKPIRTWLCASYNFRRRGERKEALDAYYDSHKLANESRMDFCIRNGWSQYIYEMLVVDYLILNRDRHGANMEVLVNPYTKTIRLAPLFDHGISFFCRTQDEAALEKADVMEDKEVQCFVGSRSSRNNLNLIPQDQFPKLNPLKESDRPAILDGLQGIISRKRLDLSWDMIWRRWNVIESICCT